MFKKLMIAAAVACSAFAFMQSAEAKTNVIIGIGGGGGCIGNPYYCGYAPGYDRWDGDDGWDDNGYGFYDGYRPRHVQRAFIRDSLRCKEARWLLEERGWRNVRARDCNGVSYSFTASRRGAYSAITVNSYSGRITSIRRLR